MDIMDIMDMFRPEKPKVSNVFYPLDSRFDTLASLAESWPYAHYVHNRLLKVLHF